MSYWIRWQLGDFPLNDGTYFIGRSPAAHIVLSDPRVSRSHASVIVDAQSIQLRDLNSQNGVYVNGRRINEATLVPGDRLVIGGFELELVETNDNDEEERREKITNRDLTSTQRLDDYEESETGWSTRRADPMDLLAAVAEKTLSLGRPADAERMVQIHLKGGLEAARQGNEFNLERAEKLAGMALKLGAALRKPEWINYVFELYSVLRVPCPASVVETLYGTVRQAPPSLNALRTYIAILRARAGDFGPAERFLVQRIEGLERVLAA